MILDDIERMRALDPQGMLSEIDNLPDQLQRAWDLGLGLPLPQWKDISRVLIAGMGGSAIGGDLLAAYLAPEIRVPVTVLRSYDLPAFAAQPDTLLIASSHSGNTEETLSTFDQGLQAGVRLMAVATDGDLVRRAEAHAVPVWQFEHAGQPRAAVGYSFALLLACLFRLGLISDPTEEVASAVAAMKLQQQVLRAEVEVTGNPAKRMAGQFIERLPVIIGSGWLAPVARRWRTQIAEIAKAVAQFEELPEADHNMVAGVEGPEALRSRSMVVFLRASLDHPRNLLRIAATRQVLMVEGFNTDIVDAAGDTRLAQQWSCLHFGDYTAFYLAMEYGVNPTPVRAIEDLKRSLRQA